METTTPYTSTLSGKGALLNETLTVLRQIDQGYTVDDVRAMVIEQDLIGKNSRSTRHSSFADI